MVLSVLWLGWSPDSSGSAWPSPPCSWLRRPTSGRTLSHNPSLCWRLYPSTCCWCAAAHGWICRLAQLWGSARHAPHWVCCHCALQTCRHSPILWWKWKDISPVDESHLDASWVPASSHPNRWPTAVLWNPGAGKQWWHSTIHSFHCRVHREDFGRISVSHHGGSWTFTAGGAW